MIKKITPEEGMTEKLTPKEWHRHDGKEAGKDPFKQFAERIAEEQTVTPEEQKEKEGLKQQIESLREKIKKEDDPEKIKLLEGEIEKIEENGPLHEINEKSGLKPENVFVKRIGETFDHF